MIISRLKEKLQPYPHIKYMTSDGVLEVPPHSPTGFQVWIRVSGNNFTVGFDGWHEVFTDEEKALSCFVFGLSPACRLKIFRCLGMDYKWQVLYQKDGQWVVDSETCLLFPAFLLPKTRRDLQNDLVPVRLQTSR